MTSVLAFPVAVLRIIAAYVLPERDCDCCIRVIRHTDALTCCLRRSGHISIPLDFLLYLYPPMHMCSGDCLNDRNGIKTFRSDVGSYGWPRAGEVSLHVYVQQNCQCALCRVLSLYLSIYLSTYLRYLSIYRPCQGDKPWHGAEADNLLPPLCFSWARSTTETEPASAQSAVADRTVSFTFTIRWRAAHPIASVMASRTTGPSAATWSTDALRRGRAAREVVVADSEPQPGPDVDHNYCNFQVGASLPPIA